MLLLDCDGRERAARAKGGVRLGWGGWVRYFCAQLLCGIAVSLFERGGKVVILFRPKALVCTALPAAAAAAKIRRPSAVVCAICSQLTLRLAAICMGEGGGRGRGGRGVFFCCPSPGTLVMFFWYHWSKVSCQTRGLYDGADECFLHCGVVAVPQLLM